MAGWLWQILAGLGDGDYRQPNTLANMNKPSTEMSVVSQVLLKVAISVPYDKGSFNFNVQSHTRQSKTLNRLATGTSRR